MAEDDPGLGSTKTWVDVHEISPPAEEPARGGVARGAALGRYVVLDCLGTGAMGIVFAADDPELDRRIAVKVLQPQRREKNPATARARLLREAQVMARLSHPNVVAVHDVGTFAGDLPESGEAPRVFVAMEYVDGITLAKLDWAEGRHEQARAAAARAVQAFRDARGRGRRGLAAAESWLAAHENG